MDTKDIYKAGVCNIDEHGIRLRKRLGMITGVVGLLFLAVMYYYNITPVIRFMITAGFGAGTALNYIQANEQFCVANALQGTFEEGNKRRKVERNSYELRRDRKKALSIMFKTAVTALAAGSFGLLPV